MSVEYLVGDGRKGQCKEREKGLSMSMTCCVVQSGNKEEEEQTRREEVEKTRERGKTNHRYKDLTKCERFKHATYPFAA